MRIIVIGDLQYEQNERDCLLDSMKHIASLQPDLVIAMGDYGSPVTLGRPEGIRECHQLLSATGCSLKMLLGNHDLQFETGRMKPQDSRILSAYTQLCGQTASVIELEAYRLLFIQCDLQPADSCMATNECYVSDQQFADLQMHLKQRPGVPVIVFSHAPILGSGVDTVPDVHVRATNAFLDQNHNPYRWRELLRQFPDIMLWFSAHYHLTNKQAAATTCEGVSFWNCGTHTSASRDGTKAITVLELPLEKGPFAVQTYELETQQIVGERKFFCSPNESTQTPFLDLPTTPAWELPEGLRLLRTFHTGTGTVSPGCLACSETKLYAGTDNGYLWEIDLANGEAMGTLHFSSVPVSGIALAGQLLWKSCGNTLEVIDLQDPLRFVRDPHDKNAPRIAQHFESPILAIRKQGETGALIRLSSEQYLAEYQNGSIRLSPSPAINQQETVPPLRQKGPNCLENLHTKRSIVFHTPIQAVACQSLPREALCFWLAYRKEGGSYICFQLCQWD